jgi:hypothetical protein
MQVWPAFVGIALVVMRTAYADAQTATQVVRFQVSAINQVAVSGDPAPLVVNAATAGLPPTAVIASGTTYAVTTNQHNQKITVSIDQPLPSGVTLEVALAAPTGAASAGPVALTTSSIDAVTGISMLSASALSVTYRLSAVPGALMLAPESRTVTLTIVSGS